MGQRGGWEGGRVDKEFLLGQAERLIRWMLIFQLSRQKYNCTPSISTKEVDTWHYHVDQC